ncbi:hypothetical protein [Legionella israelensis]|uniref:hypothetical protein n=1 Tax=Legionella israelensis TaxID=454 RepID=UPI00163DE1C2|nr:hypothetical protein [Legionella israelensis]
MDLEGNQNIITPPASWLFGIYRGRINKNKNSDLGLVWKIESVKDLISNRIPGLYK